MKGNMAAVVAGVLIILAVAGCGKSAKNEDAVLIRVGNSRMTIHDFRRCLHVSLSAYPNDFESDKAAFAEFKKNLFSQMIERMILIERARELNIKLADSEVDNAVSGMKTGMPEKAFTEFLLESNVAYEDWKEELKIRLMIEKVTAKELGQTAGITPDEMALYYRQITGKKDAVRVDELPEDQKKTLSDQIRRLKMENAFAQWIEHLKKRYIISVYPEKLNQLTEY